MHPSSATASRCTPGPLAARGLSLNHEHGHVPTVRPYCATLSKLLHTLLSFSPSVLTRLASARFARPSFNDSSFLADVLVAVPVPITFLAVCLRRTGAIAVLERVCAEGAGVVLGSPSLS